MQPFVSFVVATFNCIDRVPTLLDSARRFSAFPCEFLVADGGSTDGTVGALQGQLNIKVACSAKDRGIYEAWNRALPQCSGMYISFLGVDDVPGLRFMEAGISKFATARAQPAFIYGDAVLRRGRRYRKELSPQHPRLFSPDRPVFDVPHPGSLNHRMLFERDCFDASFKLAGDLDFYMRLGEKVRERGYAKLDEIQALIEADGLSRSPRALSIYKVEYDRIEASSGIRPTALKRSAIAEALSMCPALFRAAKDLSWLLRSQRNLSHDF